MSQWYLNPVGNYWLVAGIAAVLLGSLMLLGPSQARLTRPRRLALTGLRLLVLLLLIIALLRPVLVHSQTKKQSATFVLLIDRSRSMQVADSFGGKARWETLKSTLADAMPALRDLQHDLELKVYAFDEQLHVVDVGPTDAALELGESPDGEQSAMGAALEDVLRREAGKRLAGVVLLSDGAQRAYAPRDESPQTPARRLADFGYPLYTLTFGQARGLGQARDVAIKDLLVNQTVFVKNQLAVVAAARVDGYANQKIPIQLLYETSPGKMQVVGSQTLQASQAGQSQRIDLSYVPQTPGEHKLTLRAKPQPGELVTTNNELSTFVTVLKGGLNVLYIEGSLRVEQKFLRRSLDASPDIKVDYVRLAERDPDKRANDLVASFRRGKYDVYIVGDVDSSAFSADELRALAKVVKEGAGLIMLGGFHTFGPGGYGQTLLGEVLPIEMDPLERQRFDEKIRTDVQSEGPLKMRPARPLGLRHYVMALESGAANLAAWDRLPPLEGANKFGGLKKSAQVLAESAQGQPLLVAQEAGGRVLAFAGDSTWHWWMQGFESEHKRFWRQVVLWLARKDESSDGAVWVKLAQRRFGPGSRVEFTVSAQDPQSEPIANATFEAEVILPDGTKQSVPLARQGEQMTGVFGQTIAAGDYVVSVKASQGAQDLGSARARFLVYEQDLELDNAAADPTLLASLARMTAEAGGQSLAPEELPALLAKMKDLPLELEVETEVKESPWDTWPFFGVFVGLLSVEWYLRKKWGLV